MRFRVLSLASGLSWLAAATLLAQAPVASVWDGVYTPEQAVRGKETYVIFCAGCHADDLAGTNSGDSGAPPLKGDSFMRGSTVGALHEKIRKTMPQDAPGTLREADVADVVAYILEENGFPAGTTPLSSNPSDSDRIRIDPR
jgi:mono/diheme cytochrome c family protein